MKLKKIQVLLKEHFSGISHFLPFVFWIGFMVVGEKWFPLAWNYALRTVVCLALFLVLRPWRYYKKPELKHVLPGVVIGVLVWLLWVFPELQIAERLGIRSFYETWLITPFGRTVTAPSNSPYSPEVCGWALTITKIFGSAIVIATIEEFFWRGWLYRWQISSDFLNVKLDCFDWSAFLIMSGVFAVAHNRILVAFLTGAIYGILIIRTKSIWPSVVAHIVTNFILSMQVVFWNRYEFW